MRVEDIERAEPGESSGEIKKRVNAARKIQNLRFADSPMIHCNAQMGAKLIKEHCPLNQDSSRLLHQAIDRLGLSARAYTRILKIARTIADLESTEQITSAHISEAIQYRHMQYGEG